MPILSEDLLPDIQSIAVHVYGEATPSTIRRIRHQIDKHGLPAAKFGGKWTSLKSKIDTHVHKLFGNGTAE